MGNRGLLALPIRIVGGDAMLRPYSSCASPVWNGLADLTGYLEIAPDLVAEVISPSDAFSHVEEKAFCWLNAGVKVVLVVDRENRTVHVRRSTQDVRILDTDDEFAVDNVVPGWRLKNADLFS